MELLSYSNLYPNLLRRFENPFGVLFLYGDISLLTELNNGQNDIISFTGSRYLDDDNKKNIARILKASDIPLYTKIVVTGGAKGCDQFVINYFNDMGLSNIICVPSITEKIIDKFKYLKRFLLIGIYPHKVAVYKSMFLERNRLIAGLSRKLVFLKGGIRSGSINTVNIAIKLGNIVYVNSDPSIISKEGYEGNVVVLNKGLSNVIAI